jgi:hypothetical protein
MHFYPGTPMHLFSGVDTSPPPHIKIQVMLVIFGSYASGG